jgi:hypothetical protein
MQFPNTTVLRLKFKALQRRHWREKFWLGPAFLLLGIMRGILLIVPFKRVARYLGQDMQNIPVIPLACARHKVIAEHIGNAIRTTANYTPWESKCLAQAMAARVLLGIHDIPYALFLGVNKQKLTDMTAHAWVCVDRIPVTGGDGFAGYTVVSTFVANDCFSEQAF